MYSTMMPVGGAGVTVVRAPLKWQLLAFLYSLKFRFGLLSECLAEYKYFFLNQNYVQWAHLIFLST